MRYVLDTSVAFPWVVAEALATEAGRVREAFRNAAVELLSPDIFPIEIGHALTKAERQGRLADAEGLWVDVMSTSPQLFPSLPLMPRALQVAKQARIGVYDCLYVALAEREGCGLLTADDRLVRSLQPTFPFITALASWP